MHHDSPFGVRGDKLTGSRLIFDAVAAIESVDSWHRMWR
jgi:hypothetical protein